MPFRSAGLIHPPGLTKSLLTERHFRACKNDPIYHPRPIPRATKISLDVFRKCCLRRHGAVFYSFFSRQLGEIMRINNKEYPNVSLSVVSDRKEPGLTGMKKICLYEATIKCGKQIQKMRSEHLGELQSWIEREVEPKMTT